MLCPLCKHKATEDAPMFDHIRHHIWDPQYGVRQDGLTNLVLKLLEDVDELERNKVEKGKFDEKRAKSAEADIKPKARLHPEVSV